MFEARKLIQIGIMAALLAWPVRAQGPRVLGDAVRDLGAKVATRAKEGQKKRIAVLPFKELDGRTTVLGTLVSEKLITTLFEAGGLEIVERTTLDKVIEQIRFDRTGFIDQETAKKVGSLAGADAIVTGTIADLATYLDVNCRLIDARTGGVFSAAGVEITKDDNVKKVLERDLSDHETQTTTPVKPDGSSGPTPRPGGMPMTLREQDFVFELRACALSESRVVCDLLVTNEGSDRHLSFWASYSRLFDIEGNETKGVEATIGSAQSENQVYAVVASRVPVKAQVHWAAPPAGASVAKLIEISAEIAGKDIKLQFRDVPLTRK